MTSLKRLSSGDANFVTQAAKATWRKMEAIVFIILQIFFATRTILKIGEYINNSLHLARKYARIFVSGHYLFREPNSFPRAKLEENCELRGTDNVQGQISEHIFAYYWRLLSLLSFKSFFATHKVLKIGEYSRIFPSFSWGIFGHVTCWDQSRAREKIWWIINKQ